MLICYYLTEGADVAQWYSVGLRAGWSGVRILVGARNFSPHHRVQTGPGAHPASYPMGTTGSFPGVKLPVRESDHSPPSSAEVKNAWSYTSIHPIRLHGVMLSYKPNYLDEQTWDYAIWCMYVCMYDYILSVIDFMWNKWT
jgi:hypothetical protein